MRKKRSNQSILLLFIFSYLATTILFLYPRSLLMGLIQFPRVLKKIPPIRVYYGGKIINSYAHKGIPKVTFEISKTNQQTIFYLLVTENIHYQVKEFSDRTYQSNIIDHLQLPPHQLYKFYRLELVPSSIETTDNNMELLAQEQTSLKNKKDKTDNYHWKISEKRLPQNGKIPDETIVICYFPHAIATVKGGSKIELPTLIIKPNIIELMGSEEKLHEASIKLQLASLDLDTIHAPTKREIKQHYQHTLVINTIT